MKKIGACLLVLSVLFVCTIKNVGAADHWVYDCEDGAFASGYLDDTTFKDVSSDNQTFTVTVKYIRPNGSLAKKLIWSFQNGKYTFRDENVRRSGAIHWTGIYDYNTEYAYPIWKKSQEILNLRKKSTGNLTKFISYGNFSYIEPYSEGARFNFDATNEDIKFARDNAGILRLYNKKGTADYLSFIPFSEATSVMYRVREVHTKDPKMTFYEIVADKGAHQQYEGYWLIGKQKDKWVTFISQASLESMGFNSNTWHSVGSKISEDGYLYIISNDGRINDLTISAFWDNNANWFGLTRI